ncbi:hypothetical protein [Streptomyces sp. NPDC052042]|uniref:hypothetical protein n=1 Tax=Streptomyces sp. NPDC052042 TaxID=3365683 RepID=UPI0037CF367D
MTTFRTALAMLALASVPLVAILVSPAPTRPLVCGLLLGISVTVLAGACAVGRVLRGRGTRVG